MHEAIKKYVDSANKISLKYALADGFDVDPTYEKYEEDLEYCKKNIPDLFESFTELTPLTNDKSQWNEAYWLKLKKDIITNFSTERFNHMRAVARYVFKDKVSRLESERSAKGQTPQEISKKSEPPVVKEVRNESKASESASKQVSNAEQGSSKNQLTVHQSADTGASGTSSANTYGETRKVSKPKGITSEINNERNDSGESSKKAIGIVLIIAVIIIVLLVINLK